MKGLRPQGQLTELVTFLSRNVTYTYPKMNIHLPAARSALLAFCAVLPTASKAQWTLVDLHPLGVTASVAQAGAGPFQVGSVTIGGNERAALWQGLPGTYSPLHPTAATRSGVLAAYGNRQGGYAYFGALPSAGIWTGTSGSWLNLNPTGATHSTIRGMWGNTQVGEAVFLQGQAGMWQGSVSSWQSLHPGTSSDSLARATDGVQQAGQAMFAGNYHACFWTGTAASFVDLHPLGATWSRAHGVHTGQQVGVVLTGGVQRAALWTGLPTTWIDLNPPGSTSSHAFAVENGRQVGYAIIGGTPRAYLWNGSPIGGVNLGSLFSGQSYAQAIWTDGLWLFVAGYGIGSGGSHALLWRRPRPQLPTSWWKVAEVGGPAPGIGQTITALNPPVSSHDGRLNFMMRVTGANTWALWRNGNAWQPACGPGPYHPQAAINGLGRVATTRVSGLGDFVATDWNNWCLPAGATGSPPPLDTITGFEQPFMPSQLPGMVAFLASNGFNQGVAQITSGTNLPTMYFMNRLVAGAGIVSAVQEYDMSDTANRGLFHAVLFGGLRAMIRDDAVPGGENVLAVQGGGTGIGASTWTAFWSPVINVAGDTAFCASSNGTPSSDRFIVVNGAIVAREGDTIDGVTLAGFEPVGIDLNNQGHLVHTWQNANRRVLFVGDLNALEYSRLILDTAPLINLECSPDWITNIKGKPTIGDNLHIATQVTLSSGTDAILRTTNVCLADVNGDCAVDIADFAIFSGAYGSNFGDPNWTSTCDLDFDGSIGIGDYAIFSALYGMTCP